MLSIEHFYIVLALFLFFAGGSNLREGRYAHAAFWSMLGVLFATGKLVLTASKAGNPLPSQLAGAAVIVLALLATRMRREHIAEAPEDQRRASALRLGHRLFVPALLIPAITVLIVLFGKYIVIFGTPLFGEGSITLIGLALACVLAALAAVVVTRERPIRAASEGRRLLDTMGWAALLPLVLATLGGVFAASGVGDAVASIVSAVIPADSRVACVLAYGLGMVVFTMIMGNAFAAFPVMTAGIGLPLLIQQHGAEPAILGALGMLTGYCGTLMTPMAANFNLVPAALLELDDPNAVIRVQIATAVPLLAVNLLLMYWLAFK
ncbi:DUF979 domain-containing protein [Lysobacter arenosi]|uniref:DUF979 domain-containing protein n=1 Tax=Lysobacter arenosi TaxID=2795387 RepID=A0ABX7RF05_9GAMM|nr:DUF979 domain-containing protein [Lysobacter arenosi]QSX75522.1 DUF979 domain-containing protein [Lysobacter arenosi]